MRIIQRYNNSKCPFCGHVNYAEEHLKYTGTTNCIHCSSAKFVDSKKMIGAEIIEFLYEANPRTQITYCVTLKSTGKTVKWGEYQLPSDAQRFIDEHYESDAVEIVRKEVRV